MSDQRMTISYHEFIDCLRENKSLTHFYIQQNSGWKQEEYNALYESYIQTTHRFRSKEDDTPSKDAGDCLEHLVHYLLRKSGIVRDIREVSRPQVWQIDGLGTILRMNIELLFGEEACRKITPHLYFEGKNHSTVFSGNEYSRHKTRMTDHSCTFSIVVSTSGFAVSGGRGIAENIYYDHRADGILHILMTLHDLHDIYNGKPPNETIEDSFIRTVNDMYRTNDNETHARCSKNNCIKLFNEEVERFELKDSG